MFNKNSLLVPAVVLCAGALSMSHAHAQVTAACPYSLASFQGTYSVVTNYGANVAISMGTWTFDGNGNLAGPSIVNEPTAGSPTGARTIVQALNTGTYNVTCNGTGQFLRTVTTSTGVTAMQVDDFVITGAVRPSQAGQPLLATAIQVACEVPSAIVSGGIFQTRLLTRLPDLIPLFGY